MADTHKREDWKELTDEQFAELNKEYPLGETISIDDNYCECAKWTVGDRRCECGNRRINYYWDDTYNYLEVEPY